MYKSRQSLGELPRSAYPARQDKVATASITQDVSVGENPVVSNRGKYLTVLQSISNTGQGTRALIENPKRNFLAVQNKDLINSVFINFGYPATALNFELRAQANLVLDVAPINSIWLLAATATVNVAIIESTDVV